MKRKLGLALVLVFGLAVCAGVAAALAEWDSPQLGRELLRHANLASGLNLSAATFHLSLLNGAELGGVEARSRMPGFRYDLELARLRFPHAPFELLDGRLRLERAVAVSPRLTLRVGSEPQNRAASTASRGAARGTAPSGPSSESAEEASSGDLAFDVDLDLSALTIEDGAFLVQNRGDAIERLLLDGVGLSLGGLEFDRNAVTLLHGLTGSGHVAIGELRVGDTVVTDVAAGIAFERGRLELDEMSLASASRTFTGRLALDTNTLPFRYELSLRGGPLDARPLADSVTVAFDGRGFGLDADHLEGGGTVSLPAGAITDSAWVRALEEASGASGLVGSSHAPSEIAFALEEGRLELESFSLETPHDVITVAGSVSLDGELDLDVTLDGEVYRLRGELEAPTVTRAR